MAEIMMTLLAVSSQTYQNELDAKQNLMPKADRSKIINNIYIYIHVLYLVNKRMVHEIWSTNTQIQHIDFLQDGIVKGI